MVSRILIFTGILLLLSSCSESNSTKKEDVEPKKNLETPAVGITRPSVYNPILLFTAADAEQIMGEAVYLSDSASERQEGVWNYQSVYSALTKTSEPRDVYYMYEVYDDSATAHQVYTAIKKSNEKNGIEPLKGMGDEAYYHTDKENFCFLLARKGNKMVRFKVNKLNAKTSESAFLAVGKRIIEENP